MAPSAGLYCPFGHGRHSWEAALAKLPALQTVHAALPAGDTLPTSQIVHDVAPPALYVPAEQTWIGQESEREDINQQ